VPDALEFVDHNKATHDAFGLSHDSLVDVSIDDHHAQIHAAEHQLGGGDAIKLDDLAAPDDNTDLDFSTLLHGLVPKGLDAGAYLKDDGTWDVPPGGGNVIAAANIANHTIVRGDGGVKGVQDSGIIIDDGDNVSGMGTLDCGLITSIGANSVFKSAAVDCIVYINTYGVGLGVHSELHLRTSNSDTIDVQSETQDLDRLARISFKGVTSTPGWDWGARITATQDGASSADYVPTNLILETYSATGLNANQLFLHHDGNVGIGTTVPKARLQIGGDIPISSSMLDVRGNTEATYIASFEQDNSTGYGVLIDTDAIHSARPAFRIRSVDTNIFTVMSNAAVSMTGTLSMTSATSTITGGARLSLEAGATGINSDTIRNDTTVAATNVHITPAAPGYFLRETSAKKYKTKIKDMELDSSLLYNLQCRSFNSLCEHDDKTRRFHGLIADDVERIYPDMIHYNENNEVESYDKTMLMTMLLAEVQKHEIAIEALKAQLNN